jgi:hypothetical protein
MVATVMLALPGTAAAATYRYQIVRNYCYGDGGGSVYFAVKLIKPIGWASGDYFSIDGTAQHKDLFGSSWTNEWWYDQAGSTVPYRYSKYTWSQHYWREPDDTYRWHRIHLVLKVWSGSSVIATKTLNSVKC